MKRKKTSYERAKERAWSAFSKYIRLRDCIKTTTFKDQGQCVTCGKFFPFKELQAGHAIGGRNNSILFDEQLVNAQCRGCNGYGGGRYGDYSVWYIHTYGLKNWEEKNQLKWEERKYSEEDLVRIEKLYKDKFNKLNNDK